MYPALLSQQVLCARLTLLPRAGKRELPAVLRSRFTELWVSEPTAVADLEAIAAAYLAKAAPHPPVQQAVELYRAAKHAAVRSLPMLASCPVCAEWAVGRGLQACSAVCMLSVARL